MTPHIFNSVRPLVLARLNRNEAQARNFLAQRARACPLILGGQSWLFSLEPWTVGVELSACGADDWLLQLEWAGAPFELRLPASACQTWMAASYPGLDLPTLPAAFATTVLESVFDAVMSAPNLLQRGPMKLVSLSKSVPAARTYSHNFGLTLQHDSSEGGHAVYGSLSTDVLGLMLIAGLATQFPLQTNGLEDAALPLILSVEVGVSVISASELSSLEPGDTLMMQASWIGQDAGVWVGWERLGFRAQYKQDQLVVTHVMDSRGLLMPAEPNNAPPGDTLVSLQGIPVRMTFDLGERTLSLGELKTLQVGQSFDLNRPLSGAVHVRVNGALIGMGELVEIDGQVGVTLTALGTPPAEVQ